VFRNQRKLACLLPPFAGLLVTHMKQRSRLDKAPRVHMLKAVGYMISKTQYAYCCARSGGWRCIVRSFFYFPPPPTNEKSLEYSFIERAASILLVSHPIIPGNSTPGCPCVSNKYLLKKRGATQRHFTTLKSKKPIKLLQSGFRLGGYLLPPTPRRLSHH